MNLFQKIKLAFGTRHHRHDGPRPQSPDVHHLPSVMLHPDPGIVSVESVLPFPSDSVTPMENIGFLAPGHECPKPPRTFNRNDTSLNEFGPRFFRPDREIKHV